MRNKILSIIIPILFFLLTEGYAQPEKPKLVFPILKLKFGGVDLSAETSTSRAVRVLVTACIQDAESFEPIKLKKFKVETLEKIDGTSNNYVSFKKLKIEETLLLETDSRGCFNFRDRVQHEWYISERTYIKPFRVIDPDSSESHVLKIAINPWNTSWLFARDYREVNINDTKKKGENSPELLLTHIKFDSMGVKYSIDNYLHLSVIKKYNISLSPLVIRHDSLSEGNFGGRYLRDGKYMLILSMTRANETGELNKDSFISSIKKIIDVKKGQINTQIEFSIRDLKLMGSRNYIAVQIIPVNEKMITKNISLTEIDELKALNFNSGLISNTFYGSFIPMLNHQGINLVAANNTSAYKISNYGKEKSKEIISNFVSNLNKEVFLKQANLSEYTMENKEDIKWLTNNNKRSTESLAHALFNKASVISNKNLYAITRELCSLWPKKVFKEKFDLTKKSIGLGFYKSCLAFLNNEYMPFNINKSLFINNLDTKSLKYLGGTSFNYMVGSNFNLHKVEYRDARKGHTSDIGFSASTGFDWKIFNFSAKRGESYSSSEGSGKAMGNSENLNYGSGAYLVIQKSNFEITAKDYDMCVIIKPNDNFINSFLNTSTGESSTPRDVYQNRSFNLELNKDSYGKALNDAQFNLIRNYGILVCSSYQFSNPLVINESYYYVTQHFLAGDMHDPYSIKNRPWLMSIRSKRDFISFLSSIREHNNLSNVGNLNYTPIDNLIDSYDDFNSKTPSWPGLYVYPSQSHQNKVPYQECEKDKNMFDNLLDSFVEVLKGPLQEKDGNNALFKSDFWQINYCSEK
ncbi:hypothetical protein N9W41_00845 [bacterium]|nr:hypothetical protein [bacterium]